MDPLDAAMTTGEVLTNTLHVAALMIFTPPADAGPGFVDDLYREGLRYDEVDPRLTRYPHIGADTLGMWTWRQAEVDPADHVERLQLPPDSDDDALWPFIADLHEKAMPRNRPQWQAYLIDGLTGGRFAFYIKVHHTLIDGVAGMQMIVDSLSADPDDRDLKPFYAPGVHSPLPVPTTSSRFRAPAIPNPLTVMRSAAELLKVSTGFARNMIGGQIEELGGLIRGNTTLPMTAPFVRFNGRLGHDRAITGFTFDLARFHAIRTAADVTVNDVLVAVISGTLRQWLADHDELPTRPLVALCPISVRVLDDLGQAAHANAFGLETVSLSTDVDDPAERLSRIHGAMDFAKLQVAHHGAGASMALVAPSIAQSFLTSLLPAFPKPSTGYNIPLSTVRGPSEDLYYNGARLDSLFPISTVFDGLGLNITVYSHGDKVSFGCVAGRDMLPDVESLIPLAERAVVELETALGLVAV
ncbi:wax ester/triacylglycerol synthase family O-acyltransferase [Gordonia sp. NPDC003424]